jgi:hypothetical protein
VEGDTDGSWATLPILSASAKIIGKLLLRMCAALPVSILPDRV